MSRAPRDNSIAASDSSSRWLAFASLFTSSGTLICCALPALLVALGAGAALSTLISVVPGLVWVSDYKEAVFIVAGVMLAIGGWLQWQSRFAPCPIDSAQRSACLRTRQTSARIYAASVAIYAIGGLFAFALPLFI